MPGSYDETTSEGFAPVARTASITAGALVAGSSSLLVFALVDRANRREGVFADRAWDVLPPKGLLTLVGISVAVVMVVLSFVAPKVIAANIRKGILLAKERKTAGKFVPPVSSLHAAFHTKMIVGLVFLEGAAFLNLIAFLIEGHVPSLIAAVLLIALMIARFPTPAGIAGWVEGQEAILRDEELSF